MTLEELVSKMDAQMYQVIKKAIELGKWPNGDLLDLELKKMCMQAMLVYEHQNHDDSEKTGFLSDQCQSKKEASVTPDEHPLKWH